MTPAEVLARALPDNGLPLVEREAVRYCRQCRPGRSHLLGAHTVCWSNGGS